MGDPAAQKVEAELNASLEKRVTEIIASHDNEIELQMVHQRLVDEELVGLPPGGGLASKKVFIEDVYKKLLPERYETTQEECPNPLASLLFTNAKNAAETDN